MLYLVSPHLSFFIVCNLDLFVNREASLMSKRIIMRTKQPTKCLLVMEGEFLASKTCLCPPSNSLLTVPCGGSDVVLCCLFWCQSFGDVSPYVCSLYF